MNTLTPIARETLGLAVLRDIRVGQSSADWIARRVKINTATATEILTDLVAAGNAETDTIADTITVYKITTQGLTVIS